MKTSLGRNLRPADQLVRTINGIGCVVLAGFALVQYNDPDAVLWFLIYAIPGIWAGFAAVWPERLAPSPWIVAAYGACLAVALGGSLYLWPSLPAGWLHVETEREGLGVIIVTIVLIVVGLAGWSRPDRRPSAIAR